MRRRGIEGVAEVYCQSYRLPFAGLVATLAVIAGCASRGWPTRRLDYRLDGKAGSRRRPVRARESSDPFQGRERYEASTGWTPCGCRVTHRE
jgi:hypothetical protein